MSKTRERWILIRDGKLFVHTENADYNFLKHGAEEHEQEIIREEVERNYPQILAQVDDVLAGRKRETDTF